MGKIGLKYLECDNLVKEDSNCLASLKDEKYNLDLALNEAERISSGYSELTNIYTTLNALKRNITRDIERIDTFNKKLKIYIDNIKRDDNKVYKEK